MFGIKIKLFSLIDVTEEVKARTVKAIQEANSPEYKHQVASRAIVTQVIDDMLADPYWREVIEEAKAAGTL